MTASDRTPVGDPLRESDPGLPRTYGRTNGEGLVQMREQGCVSNAREARKLIALDPDDLHFIVTYDPEWLRVTHADTLSGRRIEEAVATARREGYREAVEKSRQFCARSGGCIS
jgi:hypothetical protein